MNAKSDVTDTPQDNHHARSSTSSQLQTTTKGGTIHPNRDDDDPTMIPPSRDAQASVVAAAAEKLEAKLHDEEWNSQPTHADRPWGPRSDYAGATKSDIAKDDGVSRSCEGSVAAAAERLEAKLLEEEWNDRGRV